MKKIYFVLLLLLTGMELTAQALYYPPKVGNFWGHTTPASLNWCQSEIQDLYQYLDQEDTKSFIVLKNGRIVLEAYFNGHNRFTTYPWNSAGKSLRAFLVGVAQEEALLDINDRTSDYLGNGWTSLIFFRERQIRLRNQLSMTTGLNETWFNCVYPFCLTYVANAGNRWAYHNGPYNLLKDVLEVASGQTLNAYTDSRIENHIGMSGDWVTTGNFTIYNSTARDMARFGLLMQGQGKWKTQVVLGDMNYYNQMISPSQSFNPAYGFLWWLNGSTSHMLPGGQTVFPGPVAPDAPADVFAAIGKDGQYISVSPSTGLVMVRQGTSSSPNLAPSALHNEIWKRIMALDCNQSNKTHALAAGQLTLGPNPATDWVQFSLGNEAVETAVLMDMNGRHLRMTSTGNKLDLSGIAPNVYLLEVTGSSGTRHIKKLVVQ